MLIVVGACGRADRVTGGIGTISSSPFPWLVAFMFCLSICLGSLFLVLAHHLFDAGWSVPIRRFCEHIASCCFPWMLILWIPIGLSAKTSCIRG